jgi:hypothetical protein
MFRTIKLSWPKNAIHAGVRWLISNNPKGFAPPELWVFERLCIFGQDSMTCVLHAGSTQDWASLLFTASTPAAGTTDSAAARRRRRTLWPGRWASRMVYAAGGGCSTGRPGWVCPLDSAASRRPGARPPQGFSVRSSRICRSRCLIWVHDPSSVVQALGVGPGITPSSVSLTCFSVDPIVTHCGLRVKWQSKRFGNSRYGI